MRYCIFGGSFDPPHEGHRHLARIAVASLGLDHVFWVPAQDPPLKTAPGTPFRDRLEMVKLAIASLPGQSPSDIESGLPTPSFSLHTIRALQARHGAEHAWHFLIGSDNWAIFPKWHQPAEVLKAVTLVVYPRKGFAIGDLPPGVLRLETSEVPGKSTDIRAALAGGASAEAAGLLPELWPYVAARGLYRPMVSGSAGTGRGNA